MYDESLVLKDAGLVAASAAATVDSEAAILNMGNGFVEGTVIVDVSAIEIADNDEVYTIALQGSSDSAFADTYEDLAILELGAKEVLGGDQDSAVGRYEIPFTNERNGTKYPYLRAYTTVAGSVATGINFTARLGLRSAN
ncbi:hypothetical protein K8I31_00780 [bacterium]|nr:hypothetical protein [bacterium]